MTVHSFAHVVQFSEHHLLSRLLPLRSLVVTENRRAVLVCVWLHVHGVDLRVIPVPVPAARQSVVPVALSPSQIAWATGVSSAPCQWQDCWLQVCEEHHRHVDTESMDSPDCLAWCRHCNNSKSSGS